MIKKITSLVVLFSTFFLFGCSNNFKKYESSSSSKSKDSKQVKNQKSTLKNYNFDNSEFHIKIIKHKIIEPGKKGNENGNKPVIAFWYEVKSKKNNKMVDPITAWQAVFKAEQENSNKKNQDLNIAPLPDNNFLESQRTVIKKGKTVKNAIAYELNNNTSPVKLRAIKGLFGEGNGETIFKIK